MLCPVLGFPVQERHGHTGASAVESNQDGQGLVHMTYMERLQELGVFSHTNRRFSGDLSVVFGYLTEGYKEDRARLFSEACTKEQRTTVMSYSKGNLFHHEGGKALEQVAQRGCEILHLGIIQSLTGHGPEQPALADPASNMGLD